MQPEVQVHQLWLLLCVPLTLIDTSNHKAETFFSVLSMETTPERHRHDHVHEQEAHQEREHAAVMEHGALSLHRGATLFGRRHDEDAGHRGEIREMDFFSRDSGTCRGQDDGCGGRGVPGGGGRDEVNVSLATISGSSAAAAAACLCGLLKSSD